MDTNGRSFLHMWVLTYKVIHLANLILRPVHHVKASALLLEPTRRWGKSLGPSKWFTRLWQRNCQNGTLGKQKMNQHSKIVFRHVQTRHYIHIRPSLVRVNYYLSPFTELQILQLKAMYGYVEKILLSKLPSNWCDILYCHNSPLVFRHIHRVSPLLPPSGPPGCNWHNCSQPMPWRFQNKM